MTRTPRAWAASRATPACIPQAWTWPGLPSSCCERVRSLTGRSWCVRGSWPHSPAGGQRTAHLPPEREQLRPPNVGGDIRAYGLHGHVPVDRSGAGCLRCAAHEPRLCTAHWAFHHAPQAGPGCGGRRRRRHGSGMSGSGVLSQHPMTPPVVTCGNTGVMPRRCGEARGSRWRFARPALGSARMPLTRRTHAERH